MDGFHSHSPLALNPLAKRVVMVAAADSEEVGFEPINVLLAVGLLVFGGGDEGIWWGCDSMWQTANSHIHTGVSHGFVAHRHLCISVITVFRWLCLI